jgi:hypothetical protein
MNHLPEPFIVIPAEAGIQERRLVPDFRRDDVWTPAFAGVTCRNPLPYL